MHRVQSGDETALPELAAGLDRLVCGWALRLGARRCNESDRDDARQAARLALVEAARHAPSRGLRAFVPYLSLYVRGRVLEALDDRRVVRRPRKSRTGTRAPEVSSLDEPVRGGEREGLTHADLLPDTTTPLGVLLAIESARGRVRHERDRARLDGVTIRRVRLRAGLMQRELGAQLGLSQSHVAHVEAGRVQLTREQGDAFLADYGHLLREEPLGAARCRRVAADELGPVLGGERRAATRDVRDVVRRGPSHS